MASAVINAAGVSPDAFLDFPPSPSSSCAGWLSSRISFSLDFSNEEPSASPPKIPPSLLDFEFRPEDPVSMLTADELISDGMVVPLHHTSEKMVDHEDRSPSPDGQKVEASTATDEIATADPNALSPKAPRCSSRWKELLGLKKAVVSQRSDQELLVQKKAKNSSTRVLRHFLHRNPKANASIDLSLPLLRDDSSSDLNPAITSRTSVSSLEGSEKTRKSAAASANPPKLRMGKPRSNMPLPDHPTVRVGRSQIRRAPDNVISIRGSSVDSPRMNSSGKIIFHNLGRSSSTPSSLNGGPRPRYGGMERSYSAGVRITPVLNVPVCSLRGSSKSVFGLFSHHQHRREGSSRVNLVNRSSGGGGKSERT